MSARSRAAIAELDEAVALLETNAGGNTIPAALVDHLKAQSTYWGAGWFPAVPSRLDISAVRLAKAIIATYSLSVSDLPAADAGSRQHTTQKKAD